MAKYHITKKGEPGLCRAAYACPLASAEGHYNSFEEARAGYEKSMVEELLPTLEGTKKAPATALSKLAKVSSDSRVLLEVVELGNDRTFKALATNSLAAPEVLVAAHGKAEALEVRQALAAHPSYPAELVAPEEFYHAYSAGNFQRQRDLLASDSVSDAHLQALREESSKTVRGVASVHSALLNPRNKLSEDFLVDAANRSPGDTEAVVAANRLPLSSYAKLSWEAPRAAAKSTDPAQLHALVLWAERKGLQGQALAAGSVAHAVASNPHTQEATLARLSRSGLALEAVFSHPAASESTRQEAAGKSPTVARLKKLREVEEALGSDLKTHLTESEVVATPFGSNRGFREYTYQVDRERAAKLGLEAEDVAALYRGTTGRFNGGSRYDPERGVFTGVEDSGD